VGLHRCWIRACRTKTRDLTTPDRSKPGRPITPAKHSPAAPPVGGSLAPRQTDTTSPPSSLSRTPAARQDPLLTAHQAIHQTISGSKDSPARQANASRKRIRLQMPCNESDPKRPVFRWTIFVDDHALARNRSEARPSCALPMILLGAPIGRRADEAGVSLGVVAPPSLAMAAEVRQLQRGFSWVDQKCSPAFTSARESRPLRCAAASAPGQLPRPQADARGSGNRTLVQNAVEWLAFQEFPSPGKAVELDSSISDIVQRDYARDCVQLADEPGLPDKNGCPAHPPRASSGESSLDCYVAPRSAGSKPPHDAAISPPLPQHIQNLITDRRSRWAFLELSKLLLRTAPRVCKEG